MSEKKYLLTHDEICQLEDIARGALAYESDGNVEMVQLMQRRYSDMLAAHEYSERTCHAIYDGDDSGHEFAGQSWNEKNGTHSIVMYPDIPARITVDFEGKLEDFDANAWIRENADDVKAQLITYIAGMDIDDIFVSNSDVEIED